MDRWCRRGPLPERPPKGGVDRPATATSVMRPCYEHAMALLKWTLIVLLVGYVGVVVLL